MAISCDIRIASSNSVFSIPATRLGLGYRFSAMKNLTDLVGPGHAKDIFFTARRLDAAEALRIGLVNRVAEPEGLDALLTEYTTAITTGAPVTIKAGKHHPQVLKSGDTYVELARAPILDCFERGLRRAAAPSWRKRCPVSREVMRRARTCPRRRRSPRPETDRC